MNNAKKNQTCPYNGSTMWRQGLLANRGASTGVRPQIRHFSRLLPLGVVPSKTYQFATSSLWMRLPVQVGRDAIFDPGRVTQL